MTKGQAFSRKCLVMFRVSPRMVTFMYCVFSNRESSSIVNDHAKIYVIDGSRCTKVGKSGMVIGASLAGNAVYGDLSHAANPQELADSVGSGQISNEMAEKTFNQTADNSEKAIELYLKFIDAAVTGGN